MPYVLSPTIKLKSPGMWREGEAYSKDNIYNIKEGVLPPVNYDAHTLKPHSLTHAESSLHVLKNGKSIDSYFEDPSYLYGSAVVLKFSAKNYKPLPGKDGFFHYEVSLENIKERIKPYLSEAFPTKVLISTEKYQVNEEGYHLPSCALTLSKEAANYLVAEAAFNGFGTSWKSTDFQPGSLERPIHKILFSKAIIFENLDLITVPEGRYFFCGAPLRLEGASESPVCPMLFTKDEISLCI